MTQRDARALLAALAGLLLAVCSAPAQAQAPRAERPTYQVGDKWIRNDGTYELARIDKDVYVFTAGAGKEFHLTKDLGVVKIVLDGRVVLDMDPPRIAWPLEVGKWGVFRMLWRSELHRPVHGFTRAVSVVWRVDAHEEVATPGV